MTTATVLLQLLALVVSGIAIAHAQDNNAYFRPSGADVSGVQGARTTYLRSPCPALNTLANHGYIPRNGRNLTPQMLRTAVMKVFNVDAALVNLQTSGLPFLLTLADLSKHNFIEHDVSLVHADASYRLDPAQVDGGLANDLLGRANNGWLGIAEVGLALRHRLVWCQQKRVACEFGSNQLTITFREAATFVQVFGGKRGAQISASHAYSFLVLEQMPSDWVRPATTVTLTELQTISARIRSAAGV